MTGRAEIERQKRILDATFKRASKLAGDAELLSDFARYLCVQVAGFLEQSVIEVALQHARTHSQPSVQRHVERGLRRFTSANAQKIIQLFGGFDQDWQKDLEAHIVNERKAAVDSIIALRHTIAHGRNPGAITFVRIEGYYGQIKQVVDHVADLCIP
jgi:HEPN superfamily RiboL-PSP-like protein